METSEVAPPSTPSKGVEIVEKKPENQTENKVENKAETKVDEKKNGEKVSESNHKNTRHGASQPNSDNRRRGKPSWKQTRNKKPREGLADHKTWPTLEEATTKDAETETPSDQTQSDNSSGQNTNQTQVPVNTSQAQTQQPTQSPAQPKQSKPQPPHGAKKNPNKRGKKGTNWVPFKDIGTPQSEQNSNNRRNNNREENPNQSNAQRNSPSTHPANQNPTTASQTSPTPASSSALAPPPALAPTPSTQVSNPPASPTQNTTSQTSNNQSQAKNNHQNQGILNQPRPERNTQGGDRNYRGKYRQSRGRGRGGYNNYNYNQKSDNYTYKAQYFPKAATENDELNLSILKQIEYYFSVENLVRDLFLRGQMDAEGWVPLSLIATFPRVKSLSNEIAMIVQAVKHSTLLEVKSDQFLRLKNDWSTWLIPKDSTLLQETTAVTHPVEGDHSQSENKETNRRPIPIKTPENTRKNRKQSEDHSEQNDNTFFWFRWSLRV
eukprot:TRINITY_DN1236_c0_g1_i1.p1 TRINITY_DN1236_c0_g1~~TRINITY_DN1236_c0_g1_i1.p1  ORF type:complete len:493 (-),score=111.22 TRINITY_DN1236_c0_g1_i1:1606-3084(-)